MNTIDSALRAAFVTLAIAATPTLACAAGLGPIKVFSGLGQNLRAEIEVSATATELQTLSARVASADAFRQAGLPFTSTVAGIELALDTRGERPLLRLSSTRPIDDPYVGLLVEIDWAAGNLAREYTFLLDPLELVPARPQAPADRGEAGAADAAAPPPAARAPAEAGASAVRTHFVRRGETLHRIASANLAQGVTLDQMLIALHRANRGAFEGDNINRLLADQLLVVPDAAQARELSAAQASRAVRAQAADFQAYRRALASAAVSRIAPPAPAQQDSSGSVVARVEEATPEAPQADRVQVSRSREAISTQADGRLQALEEELAARERALEDSNERLGQLEQAVRDLQQLLELRAGLPGLAALPEAAPPSEEAPAEALAEVPAAAQAAAAPEALPAPPVSEAEARAEAPAPVHPPAAAPPAEGENGILQRLVGQPLLAAGLGGLAALLLLGVGFVLGRVGRNRETLVLTAPSTTDFHETVFARSGGEEVDTGSALPGSADRAAALAMEADDGVDPVAEADVYMAYGRDGQAEEILRDALAANPERAAIYLKLLEIHAQRGEAAPFEAVARALHERTGGLGWDWEKAAALGRRLDPGNPLYALRDADSDTLAPGTEIPTAVLDPAVAAGLAAAAAHTQARADEEAPSSHEDMVHTLSDLDFTSSRVEQGVATGAPPAAQLGADSWEAGGVDEIELDLEGGDDFAAAPPPGAQARALELDFDLGDPEEPAPTQPAATQAPAELRSLADELDFDLPDLELDVPARDFDLNATVVDAAGADAERAAAAGGPAAAEDEPAAFDGELLDFDFDIETAAPLTVAPAGARAPAPTLAGGVDLSAIDLELDAGGDSPAAAGTARAAAGVAPDAAAVPAARSEAIAQAAQAAAAALDDAGAEVDSKLELAQAYEEMGDREGALELVEEVLGEGSAEQVIAALEIRKRLG